jgi:glutamate-1-semialdehyde 2,1-aminomutase
MGNGFAIAALAGKREYMELGGLYHNKERVFLLSTTHGAEGHALAAAIAVMNFYDQEKVIEHMHKQGEQLRTGLEKAITAHQLEGFVGVHGHPACLVFSTKDQNGQPSQAFRTLFMQECIKRGVIAPNLVNSFAHKSEDTNLTIEIMGEAMAVYRKALDEGVENYLEGRPVQPVYRKWNHEHCNKT